MIKADGPAEPGARLRYLDGLRGWAAVSVVVFHSSWEMLGGIEPSLRSVRLVLINDGPFAVIIFFVLSGFALSTGYTHTRQDKIVREPLIKFRSTRHRNVR